MKRKSPAITSRFQDQLLGLTVGAGVMLAVSAGQAQQANQPATKAADSPPATAEQLRQTMEDIKRRVAQQQGGIEGSAQAPIAAELKNANARIAELNETLAKVRAERDSTRTEHGATRERLVTLDASILQLQERARQLEQQMTEAAKARQAEVAKAKEESENASRSLAEVGVARAEIERQLVEARAGLERTGAERAKIVQQIEAAANREAELAGRLSKTEADRSTLEQAKKGLEAAVAKLQGEGEGMRNLLTQLEQELGRSRESTRVAEARGKEEFAKLTDALKIAADGKAKLESEVEALRSVAIASVGDVKLLGEQLLAALSENQELKELLEQMRASRELIAAELGAVQREAEAAAKEAAALRQQLGQTGGTAPAIVVAAAPQPKPVAPPPAKPASAPTTAQPAPQAAVAAVSPVPPLTAVTPSTATTSAPPAAPASAGQDRVTQLVAEPEQQRSNQRVSALDRPQSDARNWSLRLAELKGVETNDGGVMTVVDGAVFRFGGNELAENAEATLSRVAALIDAVKPSKIAVVGHTDANGQSDSNRRLSLRRAESVRDWLIGRRGLRNDVVVAEGRGEEQPIASNDTPEGRRSNRRVEIYLER